MVRGHRWQQGGTVEAGGQASGTAQVVRFPLKALDDGQQRWLRQFGSWVVGFNETASAFND